MHIETMQFCGRKPQATLIYITSWIVLGCQFLQNGTEANTVVYGFVILLGVLTQCRIWSSQQVVRGIEGG